MTVYSLPVSDHLPVYKPTDQLSIKSMDKKDWTFAD